MSSNDEREANTNRAGGPPAANPASQPGEIWASYQIRVKDHLETYWFAWFEGWEITNLENGEVLLSNPRVDHSALHGVLNKIRDLNLSLISVTRGSPSTQNSTQNE